MWSDAIDIRDFYDTSLGQVTQRLIRRSLRERWPTMTGHRLLGLGYASPFMRPFMGEAERTLVGMPAPMGVARWPAQDPALTTLVDEMELPFPDSAIDRLLVIHALEFADNARLLLRECWRTLSDGGRMIIVVPNRSGAWARLERSPFANGQPYSMSQINRLLRENMFTPMSTGTALFLPPTRSRVLLGSANAVERLGARWFPAFGGLVVIECAKRIAAPVARERTKSRVYVGVGLPQPLRHRTGGPSPAHRAG